MKMKKVQDAYLETLTLNLETGRPLAAEAAARMRSGLRSAKSQNLRAVKLIHGYGSSGKGGAIKSRIHRELIQMKQEGEIYEYIRGEEFSPFEESARRALAVCPFLSKDADYSRCNHGVTVVIL